ncbi:MAG: T9SS type A sorting domain-containing protein [Flavobacteriia bacterium]|jgi:hypothetical protein
MKKTLSLLIFLSTSLLSFGQWTSFSTGNVREISCGSSTQLIGIAGTATNNALYKYNFNTNAWEVRSSQTGVYYLNASVSSDGTIWAVGNQGGGGMIRKFNYGGGTGTTQASSINYLDVQNVNTSVASIGTGINNVQISNAANSFSVLASLPIAAYRVSIGEDGTIFALGNPTLYGNNIYKYTGTAWVNIPGNLYEISVGDADKVVGIDGNGVVYHLDENQWVNYIGAPFNIQKISVSSDGNVYVVTNATTANIYRNTWTDVSCRPAPPTNTTASNLLSICTGNSTTLSVSSQAETVEWYQGGLLVGTGLTFTTPVLTANTTYEARTISNGCSNSRNITVTVSAIPTLTLTTPPANLEICSGTTTTLTATGSNLRWYDAVDAVNYVGFNGSFTTPSLTTNTTFWVQAGTGGCLTPRTAVDITVLTSPTAPQNLINIGTQCPGPITFTAESTFDVQWFASATSTTVLGTGLTYTYPNAVTSGTFVYAQAVNGACVSSRTPFGATMWPGDSNYSNVTNNTAADSTKVCVGGTTTLSASGLGVVHWSDAFSGGNILGTGNTFVTPPITGNTNIYYYAINGNCRSNISFMTISTTTASNSTPPANLSICDDNSTTLTGSATNSSVSWFSSATETIPLFTGNSFTTSNLTESTTFYLAYNHSSCVAERIPLTVTVTNTPDAPITNSALSQLNVCVGSGAQATMDFTGTLSWFTTETGGTAISNANPLLIGAIGVPTTLNYYTQAANGNCISERTLVSISAVSNPLAPTNSTTIENLNICEGNTTILNVINNNTLVWYDSPSGGIQLGTGANYTTPVLNANTTYYVESQVLPAGCISESRTAITVTVNEIPAAPQNALGQAIICSGNSALLEATGSGTIYWYTDEFIPFATATSSSFTTATLSNNTSYFASVENNGCYSSRTEFAINVNPSFQESSAVTTCGNYNFNGNILTSSGTYIETFTTTAGCDSIVTLELTILNPTTSFLSEMACDSYTLNTQTYTSSGVYTQILTNNVGCDSTITLNLTINHPASSIVTETACLSYTLNGQTYTASGTFVQNLTTNGGCDSTLTLNLTISNFSTSTLNETACGSYNLNGETYTTSGTYTQTLTSVFGCDSIITLNLTVNQATTSQLSLTACDAYNLNGEVYTSSGTYIQNLTNIAGCDSTLTLNLTINPSTSSSLTESACNSFTLNGETFTSSGTYTQVLQSGAGCDSTLTLNLTIKQATSATLIETACGSFELNGEIYNASGVYTQTISNTVGCDSTITLNLTINPISTNTIQATACDSFVLNGETYTVGGTYTQTLTNSIGCDSLLTLGLVINTTQHTTEVVSACSEFQWNGQIYTSSGSYSETFTSVSGCDSTANLELTINTPSSSILTETACESYTLGSETYTTTGVYTQIIPNSAGCDSTITLNLTINNSSSNNLSETACDSFELNGEVYTLSGTYTQILANSTGCDSTITLNLTINSINASVTQEDSVLTVAQAGATYQWIDCTTNLPISGETSQTFVPEQNGEYAVELTLNSCTKTSDCFTFNNLKALSINQVNEVLIYPNPASSDFQIQTNEVGYELIVMDIAGKIVIKTNLKSQLTSVDVSILESGVYHVSLLKEGEMKFNSKLVVSH